MNPPRTPPTIAYATPEEFRRDQLIVRPGRGRGIVLIGIGGFLIFLCAMQLAFDRSGSLTGCQLGLLIGGIFVAAGAYHLANRDPCLILTDATFLSTIGNRLELRWTDLASAQTVTHRNITYLILRHAARPQQPQPPMLWSLPTFDRPSAAEYDDIALPIDGLSASPVRIVREIQARERRG